MLKSLSVITVHGKETLVGTARDMLLDTSG